MIVPVWLSSIEVRQRSIDLHNFEHAKRCHVEDEMHDQFDCNTGLLIGYYCSQSLTPREVLAGGNNEPYGIKTDLGWSTVVGSDVRSGRSLCQKVAVSLVYMCIFYK